jgi:hypothetical protein
MYRIETKLTFQNYQISYPCSRDQQEEITRRRRINLSFAQRRRSRSNMVDPVLRTSLLSAPSATLNENFVYHPVMAVQ